MPPRKLLDFLFLSSAIFLFSFKVSVLDDVVSADNRNDVNFNFPSLTLMGDSFYLPNGFTSLTRPLRVPSSSSGTIIYNNPVQFFVQETNTAASFSTSFSFSINDVNPSSSSGDGLAFFLTPDVQILGGPGGFLGLVNSSSQLTKNRFVAVEFDTKLDSHYDDPNDNHVGLDIDSLISIKTADPRSLGVDLKSGNSVSAWIDYKNDLRVLKVFLSYSTSKPEKPLLTVDIDLSENLKGVMYVGLSASKGGSTDLHFITDWSFQTFNISDGSLTMVHDHPISNSTDEKHHDKVGLCLAIAGPAYFSILLAVLGYFYVKKRKAMITGEDLRVEEVVGGPKMFSYKALLTGTRGFHSERLLGSGGSGNVYRAIFTPSGSVAAVKRSKQSGGTERQVFLSELKILARLRHKNLIQLLGWCCEKGELLHVYELMPNASVDKKLYPEVEPTDGVLLSWLQRFNILVGLAAAVSYLHEECEQKVIHRDIKTANIMLDENFNAKLSDFGLAMLGDRDEVPAGTNRAGTPGYMALEYVTQGKATEKSDVFSFGVVVLELACGRRPIREQSEYLVDWVWGLHSEGRITEAADEKLQGEFEEQTMERVLLLGLSCANPRSSDRPSMRRALQILNEEAGPPLVPREKPSITSSTGTSSTHID